jgi:plasmid stabilization system protein ParE
MADPRVIYSPQARADLMAIETYIAANDGEARAELIIGRIDETIRNLAYMPGMGRSRAYTLNRERVRSRYHPGLSSTSRFPPSTASPSCGSSTGGATSMLSSPSQNNRVLAEANEPVPGFDYFDGRRPLGSGCGAGLGGKKLRQRLARHTQPLRGGAYGQPSASMHSCRTILPGCGDISSA